MNASFISTPPAQRPKLRQRLGRKAAIGLAVVALHAGLVWTLQSGLAWRPAQLIVPVELLAQFIEPPQPQPALAAPAPTLPAPLVKPVAAVQKKVAPRPLLSAPASPLATADPAPLALAPAGSLAPATPPLAAAAAAAGPPAAAPAPSAMVLPSSNADYLQNPKPAYPPLSKRLGEQGKVVVRVLIGADGQPQKAELRQSSGFERLDQAALATVLKWRYLPGKRGGVTEDMWFNVPINFVLE
ncbi:MAG: energy transducer TonB [Polaromonas sp.]|nr:energy transducer TonB [Polaromonas sp.]